MKDFRTDIKVFLRGLGAKLSELSPGAEKVPLYGEILYCEVERPCLLQLLAPGDVKDVEQHEEDWHLARQSGFRLIRIWEDQWINKEEIIRSRLRHLLKLNHRIPARVCKVRRIDARSADLFLDRNHLQSNAGCRLRYGLFLPESHFRFLEGSASGNSKDKELLLAVMTFSNARKFYSGDQIVASFEMVRFSTLLNSSVTGAFSKLLNYFAAEKNPGNVMTYADADWSDGQAYLQGGFQLTAKILPMRFALDETGVRIAASDLQGNVFNSGSLKLIKSYS